MPFTHVLMERDLTTGGSRRFAAQPAAEPESWAADVPARHGMPRRFLMTWGLGFIGCCILAAFAYAVTPALGESQVLSYFLLPGVALYTALNSSLQFGAGFGSIGNFVVIALGSALAWSLIFGLLVLAWLRASKSKGR